MGQTFCLGGSSGKGQVKPAVRVADACDFEADRLTYPCENGNVLHGGIIGGIGGFGGRDHPCGTGQGGEVNVKIHVPVAKQDGALQDHALVHGLLQALEGGGQFPIAGMGQQLPLGQIKIFGGCLIIHGAILSF